MTAKLISHENDKAVYTAEIEWPAFENALNDAFKKNRGRFSIPGFRKGHAPRKIIEMNYGEGVFYDEALNALLPDVLDAATEELKLEVVGRPDVDVKELEKTKPIVLEISVDTMPHPALGDYHGMEVTRANNEVTDEQIDHEILHEREKNSIMKPVTDRAAQNGDTVTIDYNGTVDGVAFEGGSAEKQDLVLGSGTFIPGFEDQIAGHNQGDAFDVNVTFPEDYHEKKLAGKAAVFATKLQEIQEKELPEADDEFAQDVSEFDTFAEYRDSVKKQLQERADENAKAMQENDAVRKLVEISDVHVPHSMIDEQVEVEIRSMANQIQQMGIPFDQYLRYSGQTMEQLRAQYHPQAEARVAGDLVLQSLVDEQKFEASEEEINEELQKLAKQYNAQNPEDFIKRMKEMNNEHLVADDVRKKKAIDYLMTQVKLVDAPVEKNEEKASDEEKKD
ncbi:trigger factor [Peptoniphilaceae bacterium SGI.137]|nr:trigger factor [Peptoniphilaceae bacterium]